MSEESDLEKTIDRVIRHGARHTLVPDSYHNAENRAATAERWQQEWLHASRYGDEDLYTTFDCPNGSSARWLRG